MSAFLDAAFGFPAVVFTILLIPVILYWFTVMLGVVDLDLDADADLDLDVDADVDADADAGEADTSAGWLASAWQALGLAALPLTVALSLIVVFGWFVALLATAAIQTWGWSGIVLALTGAAVLVLAFLVGAVVAGIAGRPMSRLFVATYAETRSDFVGRTCVIRTEKVTADFGQAEAADPTGATVLIPVRPIPDDLGARSDDSAGGAVSAAADLRYGAHALIVEYDRDAEVFLVTALDEDLQN